MKRVILLALSAMMLTTVSAQENSYIVKTRSAKKTAVQTTTAEGVAAAPEEEETAKDFISQNFKFYSLCDWEEGMKFMVMPEKYDLIVKTFCDAGTGKEVSSMSLRHKIMIYKGRNESADGHSRMNFYCQDNGKMYYFEIPSGSFDDYCYGKLGVPTLAYLGDVDIAKEKLMNKKMYTKGTIYRIDTEYDGDGYREIKIPKDKEVTVTAVGVGSRSFPVKIIVEDADGNEFYQTLALSKTNSGMRDDEFIMDSLKHTFYGSFELQDVIMAVNKNYASYIGKVIHNQHATKMMTKGDGKDRSVTVPKMTSFRVDNAQAQLGSPLIMLTLTETESRRAYFKEISFLAPEETPDRNITMEDYFGYVFAMGEGIARETTQAARAAIQQGRVIIGMSEDEVTLAMGEEPNQIVQGSNGKYDWIYYRSKGKSLFVHFGRDGRVESYNTGLTSSTKKKSTGTAKRGSAKAAKQNWKNGKGTPL
ncbi:MAG: hypothetical protein IJ868_02555 [Prevotella sp.]|nr:hypothetical protein [Prevotella sp.]